MQQDWFNQKSNNLEILINQHLKRVVSRPEHLLFAREKVMAMRLAYVNDIFKVSECVYIKTCDISWSLGLYSINFFTYEDCRKNKRILVTLNQQMEEISKRNTTLIGCTAKVFEQQQKITCMTWGQCRYCVISAPFQSRASWIDEVLLYLKQLCISEKCR